MGPLPLHHEHQLPGTAWLGNRKYTGYKKEGRKKGWEEELRELGAILSAGRNASLFSREPFLDYSVTKAIAFVEKMLITQEPNPSFLTPCIYSRELISCLLCSQKQMRRIKISIHKKNHTS